MLCIVQKRSRRFCPWRGRFALRTGLPSLSNFIIAFEVQTLEFCLFITLQFSPSDSLAKKHPAAHTDDSLP